MPHADLLKKLVEAPLSGSSRKKLYALELTRRERDTIVESLIRDQLNAERIAAAQFWPCDTRSTRISPETQGKEDGK